ncbi:hypothetical protein [Stenotrophomonas rhizophila]|uniref:hypothetical protein n=1 Tax=Stenotrophomonas rhizophila TaxID=216778 RepID=UPI0028D03F5B|nr:hypothetical protein [Stenotrophomonas rhizophila]
MFDYKDKFYNPRFVFSVSTIQEVRSDFFEFDITWESGKTSSFQYKTHEEADSARNGLIYQVNQSNGGL